MPLEPHRIRGIYHRCPRVPMTRSADLAVGVTTTDDGGWDSPPLRSTRSRTHTRRNVMTALALTLAALGLALLIANRRRASA